jgi:hypothetical protein
LATLADTVGCGIRCEFALIRLTRDSVVVAVQTLGVAVGGAESRLSGFLRIEVDAVAV